MEINCRMCGRWMTRKEPKPLRDDLPWQAVAVFTVGQIMSEDVCDNIPCQDQLQYECDEFDRARKGE